MHKRKGSKKVLLLVYETQNKAVQIELNKGKSINHINMSMLLCELIYKNKITLFNLYNILMARFPFGRRRNIYCFGFISNLKVIRNTNRIFAL